MRKTQGSTIGLVLVATMAISIVAAGVFSLISYQRQNSIRRELKFQAANLAETAIDYAFAYVSNDVKRTSVTTTSYIPTGGTKYKEFTDFGADGLAFLTGAIPGPSSYTDPTSGITFSDLSVRILQANVTNRSYQVTGVQSRLAQFNGQKVFETIVPVVARVSASHGSGMGGYAAVGKKFAGVTTYIGKNIALDSVPMFQKAIAFQGQLHLHRGYPILGGVHTNGNLIINAHDGDTAIYNGLVSCAGRFYRGSAFDEGGAGADPYGYCPEDANSELDFRKIYTENISLSPKNSSSLKIITSDPTKSGITPTYAQLETTFDSRMTNWKTKALSTFKGNLLDKSHSVAVMLPPGCSQYRMDDATTKTNEFNNGTYALLHPNITDPTHPSYNEENVYQFARAATLLFRVECLADYAGTTESDTTAGTYKWIVKAYKKYKDETDDSKWIPLPMPSGVIGQTKVQTWATAGAQYEIATCIPATSIKGYDTNNPWLEGLFEEYEMETSGYTIVNPTYSDADALMIGDKTKTTPLAGMSSNAKILNAYLLFDPTDSADHQKTFSTTASGRIIQLGTKYIYRKGQLPGHGFFDARLGRGVSPVTINMKALKDVLDGTDTTDVAKAFRTILGIGTSTDFTGLIYVEFPTSLKTATTLSKRAYDPDSALPPYTPYKGDMTAVDSYKFLVGTANDIEKRHPDRMSNTDTRKDRTDNILPIAKNLRGYPSSYADAEIAKKAWAIPALVVVNGRRLPTLSGITGLTISTNAPLYLVGSYNADGNFATGTNITGTKPTDYAVDDPGWGEVSAGLFCDTLTILSDTWGKPVDKSDSSLTVSDGNAATRFTKSFGGSSGYSLNNRTVKDGQVEISACILTGEYPIFEFFLHALEDWGDYYNKGGTMNSPICIKGAVVGMFHSEIQHIKGAYGRDVNKDIQVYWADAGAYAIPAVRIHSRLMNGIFPPGTPEARAYGQNGFVFLVPGTVSAATLTEAGF
ncbi:MAG TPA: hypothetical protein VK178_04845 [Opitutaceae bacterium]|nr:hypothetical protein [Opitutaceae bacterium]